ncbi:MAG: molybdopterin-dependent oxidoreductase, partial [Phycisphaerales bacterium]
ARLGYLPEGANAVGAALAGVLPHRGPGGRTLDSAGLDAYGMLASPRSVYVLFGLEPDHDLADSALAEQALKAADTVICFTPFVTDRLLECADVLLPIGTFAETAGTFVNVEGCWQSFAAAASLVGDARAGWRVLRVLGNELDLPDCEYQNAAEISDALVSEIGHVEANNDYQGSAAVSLKSATVDATALDVPMYAVDAVVRRGTALQKTRVAIETRKA